MDNIEACYYDKPEHNPIYFKAFRNAGMRIQECMDRYSSGDHKFKWIRMRPMWPSYDELVFSYKQSIFSVKILFVKWTSNKDGSTHLLADCSICNQQIDVCRDNKIISCVFPVNPDGRPVVASGWNLRYSENFKPIEPQSVASDILIECSDWEKNNFAIDIACEVLRKEGCVIDSFCDVCGVDPQICFHRHNFEQNGGKHGWCKVINVVGNISNEDCDALLNDIKKGNLVQLMRENLEYNEGCIILVNFMPVDGDKMIRQEGMFIKHTISWIR